jgi:hypothetical protein
VDLELSRLLKLFPIRVTMIRYKPTTLPNCNRGLPITCTSILATQNFFVFFFPFYFLITSFRNEKYKLDVKSLEVCMAF